EAFAHPEMELELSDIACFVANWNDKASNLMTIASSLSIGLDSLVYFDNDARERLQGQQALPAVTVVDVPDDPADYGSALDAAGYFEISELTVEDAARTDFFAQESERNALAAGWVDYDGYLRDLNLAATIAPIDDITLPRVVELMKRTNQFNLRTCRYS